MSPAYAIAVIRGLAWRASSDTSGSARPASRQLESRGCFCLEFGDLRGIGFAAKLDRLPGARVDAMAHDALLAQELCLRERVVAELVGLVGVDADVRPVRLEVG